MTYVNKIIKMVIEEYANSERETSELIAEANLRLDPLSISAVRQFYTTFYNWLGTPDGYFHEQIQYFKTEEELKAFLVENKGFGAYCFNAEMFDDDEDGDEAEAGRTAKNVILWANSENVQWVGEGYYVSYDGDGESVMRIDEAYSWLICDMQLKKIKYEDVDKEEPQAWYLVEPSDADIDKLIGENVSQ